MPNNQSRRSFLHHVAGLSLATTLVAPTEVQAKPIPQKDANKLGFALVGLGSYSEHNLAIGLAQASNCYLAGIVTGSPQKAEKWAKQYNLPAKNIYNYQNFDDIIHNKDIDIVYIVLPNAMHHEFVIRAAKAGKHVMCEKPMANSVKECEEMIAACQSAGVQLGIGYRLHFEPFTIEAMRLGQKKIFGDVRFIEAAFGFNTDWAKPDWWRLHKAMAGGGPMMDVGIYTIQSSRYILGEEPLWVTAQFGPITDPKRFSQVEESLSWQMAFPSGAFFNGFTSYNSNIERVYVSATKGWFEMSPAFSYGPLKGQTSIGQMTQPVVHHQTVMLEAISKQFLETKTFPTHINGQEGLQDIKIMMAIYEAARTGQKVTLG